MMKKSICDTLRRTCLILAGSLIMAVNLKSFVRTGGLIPGGFNGLTRLIQEISALLWHWEPPFSVINFILNAIPAIISFKFIGRNIGILVSAGSVLILLGYVLYQRCDRKRKDCAENEPSQKAADETMENENAEKTHTEEGSVKEEAGRM